MSRRATQVSRADLAPAKECVCERGNMTSAVEEVAERRRDVVGLGGQRVCGDLILRGVVGGGRGFRGDGEGDGGGNLKFEIAETAKAKAKASEI